MNPLLLIKRTNSEIYLIKTLAKQIVKSFSGKSINHHVHIRQADVRNCRFTPTIYLDNNFDIDSRLDDVCSLFLNHKFDLLGSGWLNVDVSTGQQNAPYKRIDWHRDWKSGYAFDSKIRASQITNISLPEGVDVKYPWELARMQHLTMFAISAIRNRGKADLYFEEFKNEILDFIDANPVSFGINWACTMDVALRCVSWLIAYDIFYTTVAKKDYEFDKIFIKSILEHGDFIIHNLEKNFTEDKSGNHYLSNLLGLLCIGHYFRSKTTRKWFRFAAREYRREITKQYLPDGGNYEFSTAYHRLDSELTSLAASFMLANNIKLSNIEIDRLSKSMNVMRAIIGLDGSIIQIGDNDNGHAIIFSAVYDSQLQKNELDGVATLNLLSSLFGVCNSSIESCVIQSIIKGHKTLTRSKESSSGVSECVFDISKLPFSESKVYDMESEQICGVEIFKDFGLVKFSTDSYELYIRTPIDISKGKTTHLHADCLHTEIVTRSCRFFADQGSYVYTPNVHMRNLFRGEQAHNIPIYDIAQLDIKDCWNAVYRVSGRILHCDCNSIAVEMNLCGINHIRQITINTSNIRISDYSNRPFSIISGQFKYRSNGYGNIIPQNTDI